MLIKRQLTLYFSLGACCCMLLVPLLAEKKQRTRSHHSVGVQATLYDTIAPVPISQAAPLPQLKGWFVHERTAFLATNQAIKQLIRVCQKLLEDGELLMINTQQHAIALIDAVTLLIHTIRIAVVIFVASYVVKSFISA